MKKILSKIGQVLQVVLAAPVKLPAKAGNILKYIALGLGILETVIKEEKIPSEEADRPVTNAKPGRTDIAERSVIDENQ